MSEIALHRPIGSWKEVVIRPVMLPAAMSAVPPGL